MSEADRTGPPETCHFCNQPLGELAYFFDYEKDDVSSYPTANIKLEDWGQSQTFFCSVEHHDEHEDL